MEEYRVLFSGQDGSIVGQMPLSCADEAEAIRQAEQLAGGYTIELWHGNHLVGKIEPRTR
jgi:hypothetical protein